MYKLSGVTKNYAKARETVAALRRVDLVIEDGEWLRVPDLQPGADAVSAGERGCRTGPAAHTRRRPAAASRVRALVKEPKLLLADEPTGNLDEDTGRRSSTCSRPAGGSGA